VRPDIRFPRPPRIAREHPPTSRTLRLRQARAGATSESPSAAPPSLQRGRHSHLELFTREFKRSAFVRSTKTNAGYLGLRLGIRGVTSSALPSPLTRDDKPAHSSALATSPTYHRPSHAIETRARQSATDSAHPLDVLRRGGAALRSSLRSSANKPGALLLGTTNGTQGCSEPCKTPNGNQARVGRQQARPPSPWATSKGAARLSHTPTVTTATRPSFHTANLRRATSKGGPR